MNNANVFLDTWTKFYPMLPIPVANNCYKAKMVELSAADSSLKSVIERKVLRIGIQPLAALYPALFSHLSPFSEVKSSDYVRYNFTLDLSKQTLDGYEIVCAKEAAKRLGDLYNIEMKADFVLVSTDSFFEPLANALINDEIDVIWSALFVVNDSARTDIVDYVCNSYSTDMIIAASPDVGSARPDPNGPNISIPCYSMLCDSYIPPPFIKVPIETGSNFFIMNKIAETTDEFNYTIAPFEQLRMYFIDHCPNCTEVDMSPIVTIYQTPATKKKNKTELNSHSNSAGSIFRFKLATASMHQISILISLLSFLPIVYKYF